MFLKTHFGSFHENASQNSKVICSCHEGCPQCSLLWKVGLDIPLHGVLVTIFVSHSFSCLNDLKLGIPYPWQRKWFHSIWFFTSFQKKLYLLTFTKGNKVFDVFNGISSQKSEIMIHLKTLTMVSMETKDASRDSLLDKLSEKFYLN